MTDYEADLRALREGLEALADKWDEHNEGSEYWRVFGPQVVSIPFAVRSLRALLAPSPAEGTGEALAMACPCGCGLFRTVPVAVTSSTEETR